MSDSAAFDRRSLMKAASAAAAAAATASIAGDSSGSQLAAAASQQSSRAQLRPSSAIIDENRRPGTLDWQLTYVRNDPIQSRRSKLIEGYCSQTSARAGDEVTLYLSAEPAATVYADVYRLGYYQGLGGRHVTRLGPFQVQPQPEPPMGPNRLRECRWAPATTFSIPADWLSGVYLFKLSCTEHRYQSYAILIVRDDRPAELLFQCSDHTWQAYNQWPFVSSLYDADPPRALNGTTRVSFDRPYAKYPQVVDQPLSQGSGEFLCWEYPLAFWLEREGFDVTYISNQDTHANPETLKRGRVFLSVGHDEYWSLEMYRNMEAAIADGLSVAWLSGNTCCFVAPLVPGSDGRPNRVFHRAGRYGGLLDAERDFMGPFDMVGPNENRIIGARTIDPFNGSDDWTVAKPEHWIFAGTGLQRGDRFPGLVGWEFHGDPAPIAGLEIVAEGVATNAGERQAHWMATVYPGPRGNWVFNASTIYWSMGLSTPPGFVPPMAHFGRPLGADPRVAMITRNFFQKCGVTSGSGPA